MAKVKKKLKYKDGGQNPPIYTSDPNDPRLLAYRDSLDVYNLSNKIERIYPKLPEISKEEYDKLVDKLNHLPYFDIDKVTYLEDKKIGAEKDLKDYIYQREYGDYNNPIYLKNNKKELGKYSDNVSDFAITLKNGEIKVPGIIYDNKPEWDDYTIYNPKTKTSRNFYIDYISGKPILSGIYTPNIEPETTKYYGEDKLTPIGGVSLSSTGWYKGKKPALKDLANYTNNIIELESYNIYKKPVQPVILNNNKYEADKRGLDRKKQIPTEVEKMTSNHINSTPINNTINPIPFEPNTYFTRERQGQELGRGKTDYFDKKTGKLLGTYENGGYFAMGGEINRYMVPAELPTGQEYFKLPFNELNAALASKQANYDKSEAEVSALDKLFPQAGYRTEERAAAYKEKYTTEIDALKKQLQETGRLDPYKITDVASRMIKDPEYAAINQDFKYREAVDKMMSAGNFQDYIQNFHNGVGYNQTKPGESFSGDWYRALPPANHIPEYIEMTKFHPIKSNIESTSGMQVVPVVDPATGLSESWLMDKRTKQITEKLDAKTIKKYLTDNDKALLREWYDNKGLPGKNYRQAWYEKTYGKPYSEDVFYNEVLDASKYNQYNYTQIEDISRKVGEINASHKSGSGSGANASVSPAESITTSAWVSFHLPETLDSFNEQRDFINNFASNTQKFIADQESDLTKTAAKILGTDKVNASITRDPNTGKVTVNVTRNDGTLPTEAEQLNLMSAIKPYEQAVTQEFNTRENILNIWKQAGILDKSGKIADEGVVKFYDDVAKKEEDFITREEMRITNPTALKKYNELYSKDPKAAHEFFKSQYPDFYDIIRKNSEMAKTGWINNAPSSISAKTKQLNQTMENMKSAIIPAVSWYTPTNTPGDARIALGQFRNAMITYTNSDKIPTYRADGKQLSPEDFQKFNELVNVVDDASTASDDKALNFASKAPGFVTYRFDPSKGLVMDVTMPGFTRQDASKVNKNTQAQASVVTFEMSPSQQEAVKQQLGMTGEDQAISIRNDMTLHFFGNDNQHGQPGLPYEIGNGNNKLEVKLDLFNSKLLGEKQIPHYKVDFKGTDLTLNNPILQNNDFKISQLGVLLNTLPAYTNDQFEKAKPSLMNSLQSMYGLSPEIASYVLNNIR